MIDPEIIENWFTYHPPKEGQQGSYKAIREAGRKLAMVINEFCPDSADKSDAIRKVREAVFTANAAIACEGK